MNISGYGKKSILGFEDYNTIWQLIYFSFQNPDSPYWICRPAAKSNQKKKRSGMILWDFFSFHTEFWGEKLISMVKQDKKKRLSFSNQNFIVKFFFLHIYTLICVLENYRFSPMCFYQVYYFGLLYIEKCIWYHM